MKRLNWSSSILVLIILFACSKKDPQPILTILENGDMETGSTTVPNAWLKVANGGTFDFSWTTDESSSQTHSLKIISSSNDATRQGYWFQEYVGVIPVGKDVTLRVKMKGNLAGAGAFLHIRTDATISTSGNSLQGLYSKNLITGTLSNWTSYEVTLPNVSSSAKSISIAVGLLENTTGTVYFDDAVLTY